VANYLHIFLAMGGVLRSQVERLMQGFEASSAPISAVEWHQYRSRMDTYFVKFKELMSCLHDQYLPGLMKVYKAGTIQERFAPELQPLRDLYADMMAFQKRMNSIAESSLKIITPNGTILAPPFFKENIFITSNWSKYENEQNIKMKKTMNLLAA